MYSNKCLFSGGGTGENGQRWLTMHYAYISVCMCAYLFHFHYNTDTSDSSLLKLLLLWQKFHSDFSFSEILSFVRVDLNIAFSCSALYSMNFLYFLHCRYVWRQRKPTAASILPYSHSYILLYGILLYFYAFNFMLCLYWHIFSICAVRIIKSIPSVRNIL